jgi:endonuclease YncB( thermonuclease family)
VSGVLSVVGLVVLAVGLLGLLKGGVRRVRLASRGQSAAAVALAVGLLAVSGSMASAQPSQSEPQPQPRAVSTTPRRAPSHQPEQPHVAVAASPRPTSTSPLGALLHQASGGDGDSWHDTRGAEYRMAMVNAPETNECGGAAATAYRKRALAAGFYARTYSTDRYGRKVAVVSTRAGVELNVLMASKGLVNDRYLAEFRHENPPLARRLDAAFARARAEGAGVWGTCRPAPAVAPQPVVDTGSRCHPDYVTCVPVKGDGSGRGSANDLDCGDIGRVVQLRAVGRDPYRLDANGDGVGCESYG